MESKKCIRCKTEKPVSAFWKLSKSTDGFYCYCKLCSKHIHIKKNKPSLSDLLKLSDLFIYANGMEGENFKQVKGFETRFWISDFGRIVSCDNRRGCINFLNPKIDGSGYYNTQLRMKPKSLYIRIHQLEATHFLLPDPLRTWVNHKDGIKLNNHIDNIEFVTPAENVDHAVTTGLMDFKGEKHPNSKLTKENVLQMRELSKQGIVHSEIAKQFNVCRGQASAVISGINWGWLK